MNVILSFAIVLGVVIVGGWALLRFIRRNY